MKEATGELNMTVVTVVAIAAVGAFFYLFIWPSIQRGIALNTCKNSYSDCMTAESVEVSRDTDGNYTICTCDSNVHTLDN